MSSAVIERAVNKEDRQFKSLVALSPWRRKLREIFFPFTVPSRKRHTTRHFSLSRGVYEDALIVLMCIHLVCFGLLYRPDLSTDSNGNSNSSSGGETTEVILRIVDYTATLIYTIDVALNFVAFGLDAINGPGKLFAVLIPVAALVMSVLNLAGVPSTGYYVSVFRVYRVVRPVLSTTQHLRLRSVVEAIRACVKELTHITFLFVTFLMWFAVSGLIQFGGGLHGRCVNDDVYKYTTAGNLLGDLNVTTIPTATTGPATTLVNVTGWTGMDFVCGRSYDQQVRQKRKGSDGYVHLGCTPTQVCDTNELRYVSFFFRGFYCPYGYSCVGVYQNPMYSYFSFDNFGAALLTTFTMMTSVTLFDGMFITRDATNIAANWYCTVVLVLGCFLVLNLVLFVIVAEYDRSAQRVAVALKNKRKKKRLERRKKQKQQGAVDGGASDGEESEVRSGFVSRVESQQEIADEDEGDEMYLEEEGEDEREARKTSEKTTTTSIGREEQQATREAEAATATTTTTATTGVREVEEPLLQQRNEIVDIDDGDELGGLMTQNPEGDINAAETDKEKNNNKAENEETAQVAPEVGKADKRDEERKKVSQRRDQVQKFCAAVVGTETFDNTFTLITAVNVLSLCVYHYDMDQTLENVLDVFNYVLLGFFAVETALRLGAEMDLKKYLSQFFNLVDLAVLVLCPLLELVYFGFRALRVLRCLKLLRPFPTVYLWLQSMGKALQSAPLPMGLLFLLLSLFSAFGVQIFGGRFCGIGVADTTALSNLVIDDDGTCDKMPRANFDRFGMAFLSSVQLVTGDDWHIIMLNGMRASGDAWAIAFVLLFLFGNVFLLNLVVAIILSSRSIVQLTKEDENRRLLKESDNRLQRQQQQGEGIIDDDDDDANLKSKSRLFIAAEIFFTIAIVTSSVAMGLEDPMQAPDTTYAVTLYTMDVVVTCVFLVELVSKSLTQGLVRGERSYLRRSHWNKFDFFLIIISCVGLLPPKFIGTGNAAAILQGFKVFRVLRPVRLLLHFDGMKIVLDTIFRSSRRLWYVFVIGCVFLVMWGVGGVLIFKGKLRMCRTNDEWHPTYNYTHCKHLNGTFSNNGPNFDHIGASTASMIQVATLNNWAEVMWRCMDATGYNEAPRRNAFPLGGFYVLSFAFFGGIFFTSIFGAVLLHTYNALATSTTSQRAAAVRRCDHARAKSSKRLMKFLPRVLVVARTRKATSRNGKQAGAENDDERVDGCDNEAAGETNSATLFGANSPSFASFLVASPSLFYQRLQESVEEQESKFASFRLYLWHKVHVDNTWGKVMSVVIVLAFIALGVQWHNQPKAMTDVLLVFNSLFSLCFVVDVVVRVLADGLRGYLSSGWGQFDLVVTATGVFVLTLMFSARFVVEAKQGSKLDIFISSFSFLSTVRILRFIHFRKNSNVDRLLTKTGRALLDLRYVGAFALVIVYVFAVLGAKLFGLVKQHPYGESTGLDRHTNFENIWNSVTLLVRGLTQGNWPKLFRDCSIQPPFCSPHINNCGLAPPWPEVYFLLFILIGKFVLRNLFLAVIIQTFNDSARSRAMTEVDAHTLCKLWVEFDTRCSGRVPATCVLPILFAMDKRWAVSRFQHLMDARQQLASLLRILTALRIEDVRSETVSATTFFDAIVAEGFAFGRNNRSVGASNDALEDSTEVEMGERGSVPSLDCFRYSAVVLLLLYRLEAMRSRKNASPNLQI